MDPVAAHIEGCASIPENLRWAPPLILCSRTSPRETLWGPVRVFPVDGSLIGPSRLRADECVARTALW